jgi:signal transduction histidine kinase
MARPVAGSYDRLVKRLAARAAVLPPQIQDLALAAALATYNVGSLIPEVRQLKLPYAAFTLVVLQTLPLIWRRRWPVVMWLVVGIPRNLYDLLGIGFAPLALSPLIIYYTVMDRSSTRVRWVVSVVTLADIATSATLPGHTAYNFFVGALEFAAAGMAGLISRTRRAYLREVEARAEQAQTERDRQVALAAAQERTRIARELHDVVAHHVSLMAVQSEAAASLLPARPAEAGKSVEIIGQTAREALAELRRLLGVLRGPADPGGRQPGTSPAPSIGDLGRVLEQVRQAGITVDLRVEGSPDRLAPGVDLTVYRIVQEALTNTVRHSGAGTAAVTVSYEPGYVTVSVTDTGNGTAVTASGRPVNGARAGLRDAPEGCRMHVAGPAGFGLAGITERVAACGGSLTVGPGQAGGFAVTARLPAP